MPHLRFTLKPVPRVDRRPSRVAYALPTLFTAGNIFLGFLAIMRSFQGAMAAKSGSLGHNDDFSAAAIMIGAAVVLDGLDGRIARMTNTVSDFGREMDSLADAITFGLAPAVLAFAWGVFSVDTSGNQFWQQHLFNAGYFAAFMFLVCGCLRLARFNVQVNPIPKNPGRPDRKYFVGLPIPAGAGLVAAIVHASDSVPLQSWPFSVAWLALLLATGFLMVSTWRYYSFKDLNLLRPRNPMSLLAVVALVLLIAFYSQPVLLALATSYVGSGVIIRLGGLIRRTFRRTHRPAEASS